MKITVCSCTQRQRLISGCVSCSRIALIICSIFILYLILTLMDCTEDVVQARWQIMLRWQNDKTEVIILGEPKSWNILVGKLGHLPPLVKPHAKACIILHSELSLHHQICSVVESSNYKLRIISALKRSLSQQGLDKVIHAFITSHLNYCNSLYHGLPTIPFESSAFGTKCSNTEKAQETAHITSVLVSLHWLPVHFRIQSITRWQKRTLHH